jgi:hypothetical protein
MYALESLKLFSDNFNSFFNNSFSELNTVFLFVNSELLSTKSEF